MSDGNQLPPAGERTACPTYSAKRLIQQGGAGGFACRSHGHNQWSASKMNKFPLARGQPRQPACTILVEPMIAAVTPMHDAPITGRGVSRRDEFASAEAWTHRTSS